MHITGGYILFISTAVQNTDHKWQINFKETENLISFGQRNLNDSVENINSVQCIGGNLSQD